jgi:hypothetical protein
LTPPSYEDEAAVIPRAFTIIDHKNNAIGSAVPEWVNRFVEGGSRALIAMETNLDTYLFIARSEGNNFNALRLWEDGFNAELDFPRLAAARVEARFRRGVHFPDEEYGIFYETLIRAVSDARWTGMIKEDDFWIRRRFFANDEEPETEDWAFLILVNIGKTHFESQLNSIFQNISPSPPPAEIQRQAFNQVVRNFYEGF